MKLAKNKKGFNSSVVSLMSALGVVAVFLVILAIILGQGADILSDIQGTQTVDSASYNASQGGLDGITELAGKQTTFMTIVAVGAIIAILFAAFSFVRR